MSTRKKKAAKPKPRPKVQRKPKKEEPAIDYAKAAAFTAREDEKRMRQREMDAWLSIEDTNDVWEAAITALLQNVASWPGIELKSLVAAVMATRDALHSDGPVSPTLGAESGDEDRVVLAVIVGQAVRRRLVAIGKARRA